MSDFIQQLSTNEVKHEKVYLAYYLKPIEETRREKNGFFVRDVQLTTKSIKEKHLNETTEFLKTKGNGAIPLIEEKEWDDFFKRLDVNQRKDLIKKTIKNILNELQVNTRH